jgi:hypothetical protein
VHNIISRGVDNMVLPNIGVVVTKKIGNEKNCDCITTDYRNKSIDKKDVYFIDPKTHKEFVDTFFSLKIR